ncbi:MAG: phospholipase D-like domain-containing protein [Desulfobacteraceae bacterium]|nr:phospholipase D-like domain-containing protein [Desulfobacteraceae bacterium]
MEMIHIHDLISEILHYPANIVKFVHSFPIAAQPPRQPGDAVPGCPAKSPPIASSSTLALLVVLLVLLLPGCVSLPPKGEFLPNGGSFWNPGANPQSVLARSHLSITRRFSHSPPVPGNRVSLLAGGENIYAEIFEAISKASSYIHIESFLVSDDKIGAQLSDILLRKRAEGVEVNLIYDSFGSRKTSPEFFRRLERAGIETLEFNPINYFNPVKVFSVNRKPTRRDHRKIVVVDGVTGFLGSVNFGYIHTKARKNAYRRLTRKYWQDFQLRIDGPAVAELEKLYLRTWEKWKGPKQAKAKYYPPVSDGGDQTVQLIGTEAGRMNRVNYMAYLTAFANAQRSIHVVNPYLVPQKDLLEELIRASSRGVDVRIVVPRFSDSPLASHASRYHYRRLLQSGATIYLHPGMIHAKAAIVDGSWSVIGTTNLDNWSLMGNDEVDAFVMGQDFAGQLETLLQKELSKSHRLKPSNWFGRPFGERLKDWIAHIFQFWA